ncbi:MAG: FAD:protein FMN transferase [Selenomonadaceae bacterium]|nr:FAD:protein FMN transferase [Selenomonadaceae bacterium]
MKKFLSTALLVMMVLMVGCGRSEPIRYERSEKIMGTVVTLKATGDESQAAVDESFDRVNALVDEIMNDMKRLEAADAGEYVSVGDDVFTMLELSQRYAERTDGAFDVTVGAALDMWRAARQNKTLPTDDELESVKGLVGYEHLHLRASDNSVMVDVKGVKINLGGVAKGYAADLAHEIFIEHGIADGLIDFGTSTIYAIGKKRIGIKNPRGTGMTDVVELRDGALSTSGDYERYFEIDGKRYHHIIEPKTCMPIDNGIASVSVVVDGDVEYCATVADILSTSVFVLGVERAAALLPQTDYKLVNVVELNDD